MIRKITLTVSVIMLVAVSSVVMLGLQEFARIDPVCVIRPAILPP